MNTRSLSSPWLLRGVLFGTATFFVPAIPGCTAASDPGGASGDGDGQASVVEDSDGDGVADGLGNTVDNDGDGQPDELDLDNDGTPDGTAIDLDGDGQPDGVGIDTDGDGIIDSVDTNGDGEPDVTVEPPSGSGGSGNGGNPSVGASPGTGGTLPTTGPWTPGITSTVQTELPDGEPVACEWDWTIRLLTPFPNYQVGHSPRRMYNASCGGDTPNPKYFASYTVGTKVDAGLTGTSGAITVTEFDPETESLVVRDTYHFPECRSMHGIAAGDSCGHVAALCRIENTATGEDHDPVATYSDSDWITNENECGNTDKMNDHMWLYEWPDGDLSKEPVKIIVHKSIGSWEYGSNYLRYGENDNSYGIALKTTVGENGVGSGCHEADSYMVLDRTDYTFTNRGWDWACATGHTTHNRPAYDPETKKYALFCSTDWNDDGTPNEVELAFRREDQGKHVIQHLSRYSALWIKGGAGPLIARAGGGYLGLFVGEPTPLSSTYDDTVPTQIGLVTYDTDGNAVGGVNWIASNPDKFLSWPQIVPLGGDRYLVGWGEGYEVGTKGDKAEPERNLSLRVPWTYYVQEFNGDGTAVNSPAEVTTAGWGEMNEMQPLGDGRAAWSYVPDDRRPETGQVGPDCNQDSLVHYVYTSDSI